MTRVSLLSAPFMLGFESFEQRIDRMAKASDGYPPYNIERLADAEGVEIYQIAIAVAGFSQSDLEITSEANQLQVCGCIKQAGEREFLHRGIATRQFKRSFLLADGMHVVGAHLRDGMLMIDVERPKAAKVKRTIEINV
ncbi:MAG: Hsp20 family protein, partial [Devosiaceae bacterium]|nr:Hsp20 family protein [Devosiaceae bacterium]